MRRLMWFTIGAALACGLWVHDILFPELPLLGAGVLLLVLGRKTARLKAAGWVLFGCVLAFSWCSRYDQLYVSDAAALNEKTEEATIRVTDYSWDTRYGIAAEGKMNLGGRNFKVRVYLREQQYLMPGHILSGPFRFSLTTPEGANTYHSGEGIFLLAYQAGALEVGFSTAQSIQNRIADLRHWILDTLDDCFPADTAPFARALLLGNTSDLSYQVDTSFKVSGIRHVVAVSGLHVSILFAILGGLTLHRRWLTALVSYPALALFAALAGFSPSVNRACIMAGLLLLATLTEREYDGPTALSFAVLVMLLWNPLVITSVGFQLSVSSVAGIYLFKDSIYRWLTGWKRGGKVGVYLHWFAVSVSISLSAMVLTVPLCAKYFHTVSLIGVLTNLLTLWLIALLFYGIMGVCLVSLIWTGGAVFLANCLSWPIRYILVTAKILAKFPLAAVYTRSPYVIAWLVFVYVLLIVFRFSRNRRGWALACCATLGLCFALLASYVEPLLWDTSLTVLDVGQGQCILVETGGRTCMVDCGGTDPADLAAETLLSRGVFRLDGLILSHPDWDHAGGAEDFLTRIPTDILILPPTPMELSGTGERIYVTEPLEISFGDAKIQIFPANYPGTGSENSLCVLFDTKKCDILITGDRRAFGERSLLRQANLSHVEVLIAGHHGSADSTCDELLRAVTPDIVCISVGKDNPYGHPAPELLERLRGRKIYRTDQNGTITIRR